MHVLLLLVTYIRYDFMQYLADPTAQPRRIAASFGFGELTFPLILPRAKTGRSAPGEEAARAGRLRGGASSENCSWRRRRISPGMYNR